MRICIIGPSHLAALRTADQKGLVDRRGHEITFMGHRSRFFSSIAFDQGRLFFDMNPPVRPLAADLKSEVNIAEFDGLFFHGVSKPISKLFQGARGARMDISGYSEGMRRKLANNLVRQSRGFDYIAEVRKAFAGPILVSARPENAVPPGKTVADAGNGDTEIKMALIGDAFADLGLRYLPQPIETMLNGEYTRKEYSVGSVTLGGRQAHGTNDLKHMNLEYGALVFNQALDALADTVQRGCGD